MYMYVHTCTTKQIIAPVDQPYMFNPFFFCLLYWFCLFLCVTVIRGQQVLIHLMLIQ